MSFPQYCRYRKVMKRIETKEETGLKEKQDVHDNILFRFENDCTVLLCRDGFRDYSPELWNNRYAQRVFNLITDYHRAEQRKEEMSTSQEPLNTKDSSVSDNSSYVSDNNNHVSDNSNYVSDNSNYVIDNSNYVSDNSNYVSDNSNY
eukprot:Awhi_evm1s11940